MSDDNCTRARWEALYRLMMSPEHYRRIFGVVHNSWRILWHHVLPEDWVRLGVCVGIENATRSMAQNPAIACPRHTCLHGCIQCSDCSCPLLHLLVSDCIKAARSYLSNQVTPHYRRVHYETDFNAELTSSANAEVTTDILLISEALGKLSQCDQYIIREYCSGKSFAEIAVHVGMKVDAVRQRYYRAIAKLRKMLGVSAPPRWGNSDGA
ncbi:MAG: sigma-70 family RNA polymerase sigma factor [Chlorobiota bacterium]|nr:MAG: sigma-70 family RNA polymerase sigma factor [Chlorobiota bacterium]